MPIDSAVIIILLKLFVLFQINLFGINVNTIWLYVFMISKSLVNILIDYFLLHVSDSNFLRCRKKWKKCMFNLNCVIEGLPYEQFLRSLFN